MRPNFGLCTDKATDLLCIQNITGTKIDVQKLLYDKNIHFDSIQNYCNITGISLEKYTKKDGLLSEGCTVYDPHSNYYLVLHNDKLQSLEHLNWTRGHEIGHIYMGNTMDNPKEEIEAHYFAAQLLMPEYCMFQLRKIRGELLEEDICSLFNVSHEAARKRVKTMTKNVCSAGLKDKLIYSKMKNDIVKYFEPKIKPKYRKPSLSKPFISFEPDRAFEKLENAWLYGDI